MTPDPLALALRALRNSPATEAAGWRDAEDAAFLRSHMQQQAAGGSAAKPDLAEQADACQREAKMRRRVYARWVGDGRMTQAKADAEIAAMDAAAVTLRRLADMAGPVDLFGSPVR